MNEKEVFSVFASRFVRKEFRERFTHEIIKKPKDLHRRICHEISNVFDEQYKGKPTPFTGKDPCFFLGWFSTVTQMTWDEAEKKMAGGGGGYLVIKSDGSAFYAETEAYPAVIYAG